MPAVLGNYNPTTFTQEGLPFLQQSLGFMGTIYRGYDAEREAFRSAGEFISIGRPGRFTGGNAPQSAEDVITDQVQLQLNIHKQVRWVVTDRELAYSTERIIADHIQPSFYRLGQLINAEAQALVLQASQAQTLSSPLAVADITAARAQLYNKGVPVNDNGIMGMLPPDIEAEALNLPAFSQWQGSGEAGAQTQITGRLGRRYNIEWFVDQQTPSMTAAQGTVPTGVTATGATNTKGATSLVVAGTGGSGTLRAGSIIRVGGDPLNQYAVRADVANGTSMTIQVSPPLRSTIAASTPVTFVVSNTSAYEGLIYHRNFAAMAFGRLPSHDGRGVEGESIMLPNGISARTRIYSVPTSDTLQVCVDALCGLVVTDADLAVRLRR